MRQNNEMSKMATMPINKLMLNMGIPMILSMALQAVYNIVDSAFISNIEAVGEDALNALTLAFPAQMLMVAIGVGTGVGANALLAKCLGQKDFKKSNSVVGNSIFLGGIIYIIFILFGFFGVKGYIASQTINQNIYEMAVNYLSICSIMSIGIVYFSIFEKILQATGRSVYSTIAQVAGAVTNIILDPILIYGMFGLKEYGVAGAAYATVAGQFVSMALALYFHMKKNTEIDKSLAHCKPDKGIIGEIYTIGLPAIIAQALMSVMTYALNVIFVKVGENVVTAYGLFYKIQQFVLFCAFGLRDAITPIVSYSYGLKDRKRIEDGIKYGIKDTIIVMLAGLILIELFANSLSGVFGLSKETQIICVEAMRIVSISFIFAGINIAYQGVFQALNSGIESLVISFLRQIAIILPLAYIFSIVATNNQSFVWLIWLAFPITEIVCTLIARVLMKRIRQLKLTGIE